MESGHETNEMLTAYMYTFRAEEGGHDHVMVTINWYFKAKKCGYKLNERLYGQSRDGCNGVCMVFDKDDWQLKWPPVTHFACNLQA